MQTNVRKTNIRKHQRQNDRFIMDYIHNYTSSTNQLQFLNACAIYNRREALYNTWKAIHNQGSDKTINSLDEAINR